MQPLLLIPYPEFEKRITNLRSLMTGAGLDAVLITDNANKFYVTGRVFAGMIYIPAQGETMMFVRRPVELEGDGVTYIRKPEQIAESINPLNMPQVLGLELDVTDYSTVERLKKVFSASETVNCSQIMRAARAVKTPWEIEQMRLSGKKQSHVYRRIPRLFRPGMTDLELQIEIERELRLEGCLGQFRISGDSMELFMGSLLVGENADNPTAYDFAMGGAGVNGSLPGGADGTLIRPGNTIMIDMNGDFTGYMTDQTRTFALGKISDLALKAHQCSIDICRHIASIAGTGTEAKTLYAEAEKIAADNNLHTYFMGHRQKAGFIGHGLGIEINELPVIAPRSRDILKTGNAIALEPKFVIPKIGAVGIENTYIVTDTGMELLTDAPEQIIYFEE